MSSELTKLQAQRNAIKGQLMSFNTFLNNYNKQTDVVQLQLRLQRLTSIFEKFDSICDDLDVLDDTDISKNERFAVLDRFFETTSKAQQLISEAFVEHNMIPTQTVQQDGSQNAIVQGVSSNHSIASNSGLEERQSTSSSGATKRKLKLPNVTVPPFEGKIEDWLSFKNAFVEYIHKRDDLTDLGKFQCLQSALRGEALKKLKVIPVSEENYQKAWTHLEKVYGNLRLQISRHLSIILNLPKQNVKNSKSLEVLADEAILNVESLKSLGINVSQEIVVQVLQERLDPDTKSDWDKTLKRDEFPTLDSLTEFMYQRAALQSLSGYGNTSERKNDGGPSSKSRKIDYKESARSLVTSNKKCLACSDESHALYQCNKFREMSVNDRVKLVKEAKLCSNCLRNHGKSECRFGNCKTCNKKHNTLLHFPRQSKNENKSDETSTNSKTMST